MGQRTNRRATYKQGLWKARAERTHRGGKKPNRRKAPRTRQRPALEPELYAPRVGRMCHAGCGCSAARKKWPPRQGAIL